MIKVVQVTPKTKKTMAIALGNHIEFENKPLLLKTAHT